MLFDFLKNYSKQFDIPDDISSQVSHRVRYHVVFYGRVQGVGFRYTSQHLADSLGITGWVRNEDDGTVSCELQGSPEAIDQFLIRIGDQRWIDISDTDKTSMDTDPDERNFKVLY